MPIPSDFPPATTPLQATDVVGIVQQVPTGQPKVRAATLQEVATFVNVEAGSGTVSSVGLHNTDSNLTVTGTNPVTVSGTIELNLSVAAALKLAAAATALQPNGVNGSVTNANLTIVDGQITAASTGTGGSGTVVTSNSVTGNGSSGTPVQLSGDTATPAVSSYYGTNAAGTKGWNTAALSLPTKVANYVTVLADANQGAKLNGTNLTATIAANASVPYPVDTLLTFVNLNATAASIAAGGTDTLTESGTTFTGSLSLAQNCVATCLKTSATNWLVSVQSVGSGASRLVSYLSNYPGVVLDGVTDNLALVATWLTSLSGTNTVGVVDGPCFLHSAAGATNTTIIFGANPPDLEFTATGKFVYDHTLVPVFCFSPLAADWEWLNPTFEFNGTQPLDYTAAPYSSAGETWIRTVFTAWMTANMGVTFTGGATATDPGGPDALAATLLFLGGCTRGRFINPKFYVPASAIPQQFLFQCAVSGVMYNGSQTVTNVTTNTSSNSQYPTDIQFIDAQVDGTYFGWGGVWNGLQVLRPKFERYSALQDSGGGTYGGVGLWCGPPHAFYIPDPLATFTLLPNTIDDCDDRGVYVGNATRPSVSSWGSMQSLKLGLASNTHVNNYFSARPDGLAQFLLNVSGNANATVRNITGVFNSATATADSTVIPGIWFPSGNPYTDVDMAEVSLRDLNSAATQFPIVGLQNSGNSQISVTGLKVWIAGWAAATTNYPGWFIAGDDIVLDAEYHFGSYSATQNSRGVFSLTGAFTLTNSHIDIKVTGFRLAPIIWSGALTSTAVTASLSATEYASGWPFESGSYLVSFVSGEVRWATFTNGSATVNWVNGLAGACAAAGNTAQCFTAVDFPTYSQRTSVMNGGANINNYIHILDVSNACEYTIENGCVTASMTLNYSGAPTSGASFQLPWPAIQSYFSCEKSSAFVSSAVNQAFSLGWTSAQTALLASVPATTGGNPRTPLAAPVALGSNRQITAYPLTSTFDGTGIVQIAAKFTTVYGAT